MNQKLRRKTSMGVMPPKAGAAVVVAGHVAQSVEEDGNPTDAPFGQDDL